MSSTFERVSIWNTLCAKPAPEFGTPEYYEVLSNQAERIAEELDELRLAITNAAIIAHELSGDNPEKTIPVTFGEQYCDVEVSKDNLDHWNQEVLDAGADLDVVVAGLNFLSGHNYDGAIDAVLSNNDAKYTPDIDFANISLQEYNTDGTETHTIKKVRVDLSDTNKDEAHSQGYNTFVSNGRLQSFVYSIHRISDDKICKLLNHPKVDLAPFCVGYSGYSKELFTEFKDLLLLDSPDMPNFVDKHGKELCEKMFAAL